MDENEMKSLKSRRDTIRGHLEHFQSFIESFDKNTQFLELQMRLNNIITIFQKFDELHDKIDLLDESLESKNMRFSISATYFGVISKAQQLISDVLTQSKIVEPPILPDNIHNNSIPMNPTNSLNSDISNTSGSISNVRIESSNITQNMNLLSNDVGMSQSLNNSVTSLSNNGSMKRKLKLPIAKIPEFSGKLEEWMTFKNYFVSMIHNNNELPIMDKFHYLKSSLRDDAEKKIRKLDIIENNYARAWELLERAYENKRVLISRHLSLLFNLPSVEKDSHKTIESLADDAQQHVQSLASLGVNLSPEIVIHVIEQKLSKNVRMKWEDSLGRDEFPTLDDMMEFLYKTAVSLSKHDAKVTSNDKKDDAPPSKKRKSDHGSRAHAFVTSQRKCPACNGHSHPLFRCEKFIKLSVPQRMKIVKGAKLCFNCLKGHGVGECQFGNCKTCGKKHNTLLHFSKSDNVDPKNTVPQGEQL